MWYHFGTDDPMGIVAVVSSDATAVVVIVVVDIVARHISAQSESGGDRGHRGGPAPAIAT